MEKGEDAVSLLGMGQRQGGGWHLRKSSCHLLSLSPVSSVLVASGLLLTKRVGKGMAAKRWRERGRSCPVPGDRGSLTCWGHSPAGWGVPAAGQ